jgi:transcriptional regulator with XRE-family HTH domain
LPFYYLELRDSKSKSLNYPKKLKTIGDHIRKRRLDLKLLQRQVGQPLGVDASTVWNWEQGRSHPELRYLPAIISFLSYDPRPKPASLTKQLVWFRQGQGWTQSRLAEVLHVDPTTLGRWELGKKAPWGAYIERVAALLELDCTVGKMA